MANSAIVAEGLSYSYGENLAVDDVSFAVDQGEILGFLGQMAPARQRRSRC